MFVNSKAFYNDHFKKKRNIDQAYELEDLNGSSKADSLVAFAKTYLGTPYRYGSCKPGGFDCSGFTYFVFKHFGITLPRSSRDMADAGKGVDAKHARKGDLILFTGTNSKIREIGHVGIVITEKDEPIKFIHSSSSKKNNGVIITDLNDSNYTVRFLQIRRIL